MTNACPSCGALGKKYHHHSPTSGLCRSCSHRSQAERQRGQPRAPSLEIGPGIELNGFVVLELAHEKRWPGGQLNRYWSVQCKGCNSISVRPQRSITRRGCHKCKMMARQSPMPAAKKLDVNLRIAQLRASTKARNIPFELTLDEADALLFMPCKYCGTPGPGGIDRLDCTKGYDTTNSVPACWDCNRAKGVLSVEQFLSWVRRLASHQGITM